MLVYFQYFILLYKGIIKISIIENQKLQRKIIWKTHTLLIEINTYRQNMIYFKNYREMFIIWLKIVMITDEMNWSP